MGLISEGNSLGRSVIIVDVVGATIAVSAVALRLWARRIQKSVLNSADYTLLLALVSSIALPNPRNTSPVIANILTAIQFLALSLVTGTVLSESVELCLTESMWIDKVISCRMGIRSRHHESRSLKDPITIESRLEQITSFQEDDL